MTDITQADRDAAVPIMRHMYEVAGEFHTFFEPEILAGKYDSHFVIKALAAHREAAFQAGVKATEGGWIIGNAKRDKWRTWKTGEPEWTTDREQATRFARREDAEAVHLNDEDAWLVVQFCAIDPTNIKDTQP